jgi:CopG family nickel-responsive transcriptional regulator
LVSVLVTKKGKDTEIISVSLPETTARQVDRLVHEKGYPSRSELVREAVRGLIKTDQRLADLEGDIDGVMILLYDQKASRDVSSVRHSNMNLIKSFLHTDFADHSCSVHDDTCKCCEVILFSGDAAQVRAVHNSFRTIKHVEESLVFLA